MSPAATTAPILRRLPSHLAADQPGKLVGAVVDALAGELDVATTELGRVQRSRRLAQAAELSDLLLLAGLHGIEGHALELLRQRLEAAAIADHDTLLALLRARVETVVDLHRRGNGTVGALLGAAANAIDLEIASVRHSADRYVHVATCRDRLPGGVADEIVLEENPGTSGAVDPPAPMRHGGHFTVPRRGYAAVPVTISVAAVGERTIGPMVVNVDTGIGLAFTGSLKDGETLVYANDGERSSPTVRTAAGSSAPAGGTDVGKECFWFQGGVFAGPDSAAEDFVFADDVTQSAPGRENVATWARSIPPGAFERDHPLPARPAQTPDLPAVFMPPGTARWALFVSAATFGADDDAGGTLLASPLMFAARFGRSVWDPDEEPPAPGPVAALGLAWQEHEPFKVALWLPERFRALDHAGRPTLAALVTKLVERHRAAGIDIDVGYVGDMPTGRMPTELTPAQPATEG